jgi:hypothetical protein
MTAVTGRHAMPNAVVAYSRNSRDWLIGPAVKEDERDPLVKGA